MKRKDEKSTALSVSTRRNEFIGYSPVPAVYERELYRSLRENVPVIDASIVKIRRLIGKFIVTTGDERLDERLSEFFTTVKVGAMSHGIDEFIGSYIEDLLTYGTAVGEICMNGGEIAALYNTDLRDIEFKEKTPLDIRVMVRKNGELHECKYQELILKSAFNPESGAITGTSILRGLPFVSETLMKIYKAIGVNWDRLGSVRFSVSCPSDGTYAPEKARVMASEWKKAMSKESVNDFISVGDVSIKAIGSDVVIPDSEVPSRLMLEQIVAKLGIPPFLLGFSWSSTERMSSQQADILTSELEAYRRLLEPIIYKITSVWLLTQGAEGKITIDWDDISMQDELDHNKAMLYEAQRKEIEAEFEDN